MRGLGVNIQRSYVTNKDKKMKSMSKSYKRSYEKEKFDGITRPSTDTYRKRWDEIFKPKTLHEELMEGFKKEQEELDNEEE